jgi:hypothetical protein
MLTATGPRPTMPQAPEGHFWRVTDLVWRTYPELGAFQSHSTEAITVELHEELPPTRFRKRERSQVVASEEVALTTQENAVYTPGELAARTAGKILDDRFTAETYRARIQQVVGDYR